MGKIGANYLLPKALKSFPKSKKSPDLFTLLTSSVDILQSGLTCLISVQLSFEHIALRQLSVPSFI